MGSCFCCYLVSRIIHWKPKSCSGPTCIGLTVLPPAAPEHAVPSGPDGDEGSKACVEVISVCPGRHIKPIPDVVPVLRRRCRARPHGLEKKKGKNL